MVKQKLVSKMLTKSKQYGSRSGSNTPRAQAFGERIEYLMERNNGRIQPIDVVEDSKKKTSPFRTQINWNDNEASHEWRLQQARVIIADITEVVIIDGSKKPQRSFFNVSDKEKNNTVRYYVTTREAVRNPSYRKQLIDRMVGQLENLYTTMKLFQKGMR